MLGVMLQYDAWHIAITAVFVYLLYLVLMGALVRVVQNGASKKTATDLVCGMPDDPHRSLSLNYQVSAFCFSPYYV